MQEKIYLVIEVEDYGMWGAFNVIGAYDSVKAAETAAYEADKSTTSKFGYSIKEITYYREIGD